MPRCKAYRQDLQMRCMLLQSRSDSGRYLQPLRCISLRRTRLEVLIRYPGTFLTYQNGASRFPSCQRLRLLHTRQNKQRAVGNRSLLGVQQYGLPHLRILSAQHRRCSFSGNCGSSRCLQSFGCARRHHGIHCKKLLQQTLSKAKSLPSGRFFS